MRNWWEAHNIQPDNTPRPIRAVAYYRHSAQDRQENSIPIQQDQVREWAIANGVEIIQEFADHGRSGLTAEGRPAFTEMMDTWVKVRNDFQYILCLDVSRWGRFQDFDVSAQFSAECKRANKQVIYTTIGKPREDALYPVYVQFERFRAAEYSKELNDKVWRGCAKISEQGSWAGGPPPYGLQACTQIEPERHTGSDHYANSPVMRGSSFDESCQLSPGGLWALSTGNLNVRQLAESVGGSRNR